MLIKVILNVIIRSSRPEVFLRKCVLKICSKFTGEHPCRSVISIKLLCNFIEIALRHGCSPVNLQHIFRTPFTKDISGRLLLIFATIEPLRFSFTLWIYTNIKNIEHQEWFKYAFWFRWGYRLPLTNFHPFDFCRTSTKLSFASANVFSGKNSQCYFHMQQDLK